MNDPIRARSVIDSLCALLLFVASPPAIAQSVTTVAGSGAAAYVNGPRLEAAFNHPQGVAVDAAGVVYVADTGNLRVRRISSSGDVTTFAGSGTAAYDGSSDVPAGQANFYGPLGLAVDFAGSLWIADSDDWIGDGQWLKKITPDGILHNVNGSVGYTPVAVATRGAEVYVLDRFSGLWMFPQGGPARILAGDVKDATGLAVDAAGNAYIADPTGHRILIVTASGALGTFAGSGSPGRGDGPAENASFYGPTGVAVDKAGRVYVADTGNHRIRRISDGLVSTLAGSGNAGRADGLAWTAAFSSPRGLALGPGGDLYVADTGNNLIRRIALPSGCTESCTDWTVPSVARTQGRSGSFWTSDVTLHNRGPSPAALTLKFLGHDGDGNEGPERDVTIGPHQTVTYADVLASVFGIGEGWGAVRVRTASDRIAVRSRTSTFRAGGSVGDGVPGVRIDRFFTDDTAPTPVLTGLREDDRFRSNLVLVNGSAVPLEILVSAFDSQGGALGSRTYTLGAFEATQDSRFLARAEFGSAARTDVTVAISTATPGGIFTAYAAIIDNGSNAPTTVLPQ